MDYRYRSATDAINTSRFLQGISAFCLGSSHQGKRSGKCDSAKIAEANFRSISEAEHMRGIFLTSRKEEKKKKINAPHKLHIVSITAGVDAMRVKFGGMINE